MTRPLFALLAAQISAGCSPAYSDAFRREAAKQVLVSLEIPPADNSESTPRVGTAIIIGADDSVFYLVTARHVLPDAVQTVKIGSVLWGSSEVTAPVTPKQLAFDLALFTVPRIRQNGSVKLAEPFWRVLPQDGFGAGPNTPVFLIGRQHGLKLQDALLAHLDAAPTPTKPAQQNAPEVSLQLSSERDGLLDRFTMLTTTPPTGGDSGGGIFDDRSQLIGVYTGSDTAFIAYRFDRALEYVKRSDFAANNRIRLEPVPRRPSQLVTWLGVGLLATSVTLALVAREKRYSYYDDPTKGDAAVRPLNIAADTTGGLGLIALGVQLYYYLHDESVAAAAREKWK